MFFTSFLQLSCNILKGLLHQFFTPGFSPHQKQITNQSLKSSGLPILLHRSTFGHHALRIPSPMINALLFFRQFTKAIPAPTVNITDFYIQYHRNPATTSRQPSPRL